MYNAEHEELVRFVYGVDVLVVGREDTSSRWGVRWLGVVMRNIHLLAKMHDTEMIEEIWRVGNGGTCGWGGLSKRK